MIERVDQLVLEYVSRAADAAHGVLPPRQRIDFIGRLRKRIDAERTGMEDPAAVARVLARFGDPVELVRREVRRLNGETASRRPTETLEEAGRPTGVIVPAPTSSLHDSSEPPSGRSAFGDSAAPGSAEIGSVSGSAASDRDLSGGAGSEPSDSGSSGGAGSESSDSGSSEEVGSESSDSRESATGTPKRSHPYGAVPGGSAPLIAQDSGSRASGSSAVYEAAHKAAHKADSANVSVPAPADAPESADWPRSSSITPGEGEPDDLPAEGVEADDPPTEEIPPARDAVSRSGTASGPEPEARSGAVGGGAVESGRSRSVTPPGVVKARREAEQLLARKQNRRRFNVLRRPRRPPRSREDVVAGERDARTILLGHRREVVGMALLGLAGLLAPFLFTPIAIFRIHVLVWAVAALVVTACENWQGADKVRGAGAPILSYTIGSCLVALIRARHDLSQVVKVFFEISDLMFMLGSAVGVAWLAYRLFNPVAPVGRRNR